MSRQKPLPSHCLTVATYGELRRVLTAFAAGVYELVCVLGGPGLGKSEMIKRTMLEAAGAEGWGLVTGKHTPLDLYQSLHRYRTVPIVLDDLDDLLGKPDNVVMLTCLADSLAACCRGSALTESIGAAIVFGKSTRRSSRRSTTG